MTVRRIVLACTAAVGGAVLLSGCGGSSPGSQGSVVSAPAASISPSSTPNVASVSDWGCTLLTTGQVEKLLGVPVTAASAATPSDVTEVSGCHYSTATTRDLGIQVAQHNPFTGDPSLAPPGSPAGTTCLPEKPVTTCMVDLPDGYSLSVITTPDPAPIGAVLSLAASAYATNPMPRA